MDALVVGAGAVGRVFAHHLAAGGARVGLLCRPAQAAEAAEGFMLYPARGRRAWQPIAVVPDEVLTRPEEAAARRWDAVFLCTSSPALRKGGWLEALGRAAPAATFVAVQPWLDDPAFVAERVGAERLVWGMFSLMSWATDEVAGPAPVPGTAYFRPPFGAVPFSGPPARRDPVVQTLARGGLPARRHPDVPRALASAGPLLDLHVAALEASGFSLAALRRDRALLAEVHRALAEVEAAVARRFGRPPPRGPRRLGPWLSRLVLRLAPRLVPFDLEAYLAQHYTKVAEQTLDGLRRHAALAAGEGLGHAAIDSLIARVEAARGKGGRHARAQ